MTQRLGWIVAELEIERLLAAGYAELDALLPDDIAADAYLERVFWNMDPARRAKVKAWLRRTKVTVIENWPRLEEQLPCQAIVLAGGDNHEFVGTVGDALELTVDSPGGPVSGEQWNESIGILSRANSPEEILVMHQLAKFFIARRRHELAETFAINIGMSQRDLSAREPQSGQFVYSRLLQVNVAFLQLNAADIATTEITAVQGGPEAAYAGA